MSPMYQKTATQRCNFLQNFNFLIKSSPRFYKNFIITSGTDREEVAKQSFANFPRLGANFGFDGRFFKISVYENVQMCIAEAALRRSDCAVLEVTRLMEMRGS